MLKRPRDGAPLYATCSFAGCVMYILLGWSGLPAVVFVIRMLAVKYNVSLPV